MALDTTRSDWVARHFSLRATEYTKFQNFYDGIHKVELTDRLKDFLKVVEQEFNSNFCEVVVDAMTDRIIVAGFDIEDDDGDTNIRQWISDVWKRNRMDAEQRIVHNQAAVKGDAYVMVDWDEAKNIPLFFFDDAERVRPKYDPANRRELEYVARKWTVNGHEWLNLYYPDRIEKYISSDGAGGSWQERISLDEEWPVPWMVGNEPIGIPVVHFRNKPRHTHWGRSELDSVIPLQVALDKTLVDLMMVSDTMGFPQRWLANVKTPASGFKIFPGSVWDLTPKPGTDAGIQVGQFSSEDPGGLIKTMDELIGQIAAVSRTPQHLFKLSAGIYTSGVALQTAEDGLIKKIADRHVVYGNAWEDVVRLGMRIHNARAGEAQLDPDVALSTQWKDHLSRNEGQIVNEVSTKLEIGISVPQALRELGYTDAQIDRMMDEREEDKARDANLGSAIIREFAGGGASPVVP